MNLTDTTTPSGRLPDCTGDPERDHSREDDELWGFVAFVFAFNNADTTKERFLRKEAKAFLDWNDKHDNRTRWYV